MTFYNVVSALLFFGAARQILVAVQASDLPQFLMAATLGLLVFNDAVYTSHVVEGSKATTYELPLMLIDLVNFGLLTGAMIVINPLDNPFEVPFTRVEGQFAETLFWLLLAVYWGLVLLWTARAKLYPSGYPLGLLLAALGIGGVFLLAAVSTWLGLGWGQGLIRAVAFGYPLAYIVAIRPVMLERWRKSRPADEEDISQLWRSDATYGTTPGS